MIFSILLMLILISSFFGVLLPFTILMLILFSRKDVNHRVYALFILFFIIMSNKSIFGSEENNYIRYFAILYFILDSIILTYIKRLEVLRPSIQFHSIFAALLSIVFILLTIFTSKVPILSMFKLSVFLGGFWCIKSYFFLINSSGNVHSASKWIENFGIFIFAASSVTLFFPSVGYSINGTGFQGILSHPQTFGVVCLLFFIYYLILFLRTTKEKIYKYLSLLLVVFIFAFLSESRTALLSICGIIIIFLLAHNFKDITYPATKILCLSGVTMLLIIAVVLNLTKILYEVSEFFVKRTTNVDLLSAYQDSRGQLIENSLTNFIRSPLYGIGFGVPSDFLNAQFTYEPIFNQPISTPFEKGFIFSAILEENGILGSILLFSILIFLFKGTASRVTYLFFFGFLLSNIGEYTMFSLGGVGLLGWLMVIGIHHLTPQNFPNKDYGAVYSRYEKK